MLSTYFKVSGVKAITNMENNYSKNTQTPGIILSKNWIQQSTNHLSHNPQKQETWALAMTF